MKTKLKYSVITALCFLALGALSSFSSSDDWTVLSQTNNVEASVKQIQCDGDALLSFKLKNLSDQDLTVVYTIDAKMNPTIPTITKTIVLMAKGEQSGSCESIYELAIPDYGKDKDITKRAGITITIKNK